MPSGPQATASPSIMHVRALSRATASVMRGKRLVRSLPGRLKSLTRLPSLRAMIRKPSCLISCSQPFPSGARLVDVGRQGSINPAGRERGRNMAD
jgi:hypothetical protein